MTCRGIKVAFNDGGMACHAAKMACRATAEACSSGRMASYLQRNIISAVVCPVMPMRWVRAGEFRIGTEKLS